MVDTTLRSLPCTSYARNAVILSCGTDIRKPTHQTQAKSVVALAPTYIWLNVHQTCSHKGQTCFLATIIIHFIVRTELTCVRIYLIT